MTKNLWYDRASSKAILGLLGALFIADAASAEVAFERTAGTVGCKLNNQILWQFSFSTNEGKPFFHPLRLLDGAPLTALKPGDHRWHYGLWFSWKYINGINYWEEDKTGHAQGATVWDAPKLKSHKDGSEDIEMNLRYVAPTQGEVMTEQRKIHVSAPGRDGSVTIDWIAKFKAGKDELLLDRTHMPGEEHGAVNGGYAGFSLRAAQSTNPVHFVTAEGPVEKFESDRARPKSKAAACNILENGRTDGVAIFSHSSNTGGDSPWYIINAKAMKWFSPALLAPAPRKVKPQEAFTWKFRVVTQAGGWTPEQLRKASDDYNRR
jgi:hypothetical protein